MEWHQLSLWVALAASGLFLRATLSLHGFSGQNRPPMYGDYEAQRHWQEVTVNLPVTDWYRNTTDNDLLYWGLDYPPLTAYHSYLVGRWARWQGQDEFVALHTSRGLGTDGHKHFMRNSVLLLDAVLYLPAVLLAIRFLHRPAAGSGWLTLALAALYPGQMLIDNGHFQYNNVSLALFALAVLTTVTGATLSGAVLFCLALNYKQMELYHALPFFFLLLRRSFDHGSEHWNIRRAVAGVRKLAVLGGTVLGTFAVLWLPWLGSLENVGQLVHRIFPVARGVFEDKVANVWCVVNVFVKLKNFPNTTMAFVCLLCTVLAVLPSGLHLLLRKPSPGGFLYSLSVTALGFFLFSFQVHEKSILLAALPTILLLPVEPFAAYWFLQVSTFSMFPLLHKDGLTGAYLGLSLITLALPRLSTSSSATVRWDVLHIRTLLNRWIGSLVALYYGSLLGQVALLVAFLFVPPPDALPFLYPLAISAYSCGHFVLFYLYFNYRQFYNHATVKKRTKKKAK